MTDSPDVLTRALPVPRETVERLEAHRRLLAQWAPRINLIGPNELAQYWRRHALDCAQLVPHAPTARRWIDLGSGAGFPGLVVACCLADRSDVEVALVEPNPKRVAFLREAIRATGAPATVIAAKAEELPAAVEADVLTARALAPLERITESAEAILARGVPGLFLKGAEAESEIAAMRPRWTFTATLAQSLSDPKGRIVRLEGVSRVRADDP